MVSHSRNMSRVSRPGSDLSSDHIETRSYQQEMLEASLLENIVVALDTGSGKTHIAVSWFIAPTVALCEQQHDVISKAISSVGLIHGGLEPKQWTNPELWESVLKTNRVVVSTPQVLLDALSHGHIKLGRDIGLLVFDEAHHANDNHPMNCIMRDHYFSLPVRNPMATADHGPVREERPMVLGLTASPMFGGDASMAFRKLEMNLDSVIRSPRHHRHELTDHVHRPVFRHVLYDQTIPYLTCHLMSPNLKALKRVVDSMNIQRDPYVLALREQLSRRPPGQERHRVDQKLSKVIAKESTYTHKGLRDLMNTARDICYDLGPWAADWYIDQVVREALRSSSPYNEIVTPWQDKEKAYLIEHLNKIELTPVSLAPADIDARISDKVRVLLQTLEEEKARSEEFNEPYSGLVFVTRRDAVLALSAILEHHPRTCEVFRVGSLVGSSESSYRVALLDITRKLLKQSQSTTLDDFRSGDKNLVVATSVAEEGLDIQACGNVIRWDVPSNMASWAQSRGRARKKRSSFVLMFESGGVDDVRIAQFEELERQMVALYNEERQKMEVEIPEWEAADLGDDEYCTFKVESTGALLTLQAATSHINHFCSVLPTSRHDNYQALYDIDPPDMPTGWHSLEPHQQVIPPYHGPFGCTLTLPRVIDADLRVHSVERVYPSKRSAYQHVAFKAYVALYKADLLSDHLLPLMNAKEDYADDEVNEILRAIEKRTGMADVARQINPWQPQVSQGTWWSTEIHVSGLPALTLLTQVEIPVVTEDEPLFLYHPVQGPMKVIIPPASPVTLPVEVGHAARCYTRRLFWTRHSPRMAWAHLDFAYLFNCSGDPEKSIWEERREWSKNQNGDAESEKTLLANAEYFGKTYNYPTDIVCVRDGGSPGKPYRFIKWHFDKLSQEDEEELRVSSRYRRIEDFEVTYPLLVVEPLPNKANFLLPRSVANAKKEGKHLFLSPRFSYIELLSSVESEYALLIPSILRHLTVVMTVERLRQGLFSIAPSLSNIRTSFLTMAITAPVADDLINYQRLESLGDAVLKFVVGLNLMALYRLWPEGFLTRKKDHTVNNQRLAKAAIRVTLFKWIIRNRFTPRKYTPLYLSQPEDFNPENGQHDDEAVANGGKPVNEVEKLSTKMLADVVESLIGAAYLHGGFDFGIECAQLFRLGVDLSKLQDCITKILSRVQLSSDLSGQLVPVEKMIGYTFQHKLLLIEALTHASYRFDNQTVSYERMEFLGDALLDMIVVDYLYNAPGHAFNPGDIHILKASVVNTHFLAYRCLQRSIEVDTSMPGPGPGGKITVNHTTRRIHLYQCLLHGSTVVLEEQRLTYTRFEKNKAEIDEALSSGKSFPWAALTRLQAPKFLSDIIESLIGAVYLDSHGNIETICTLLRTLGILDCLERLVRDKVDVLHPVSRVGIWASRQQKEVDYEFAEEKGNIICTVRVEGRDPIQAEAEKRGNASKEEARFAAAEKAIALWGVGDVNNKGK
ncbi:hypothetical protein ID866_1102 [Astraeus odoratus]|nr:hypothetical protein ID866_1102 [Astraeus odoratus]